MSKVSVYNMEGQQVGELELNDAVFGVEINEHLVNQAVKLQLANKRQGTQSAKTRSEVSGGGRKPWKQKGTGHDYSFKMNKKEKQLALKSVLTSRVQENKFIVVDAIKMDEIKTKTFVKALDSLKVSKALVVLNENDVNVVASAKNIPGVKTASAKTINVYDILKFDTLVIDKAAVATIEEVYA